MIRNAPALVRFAPFQAVADGDGTNIGGIGADVIGAGGVELDPAAIIGVESQRALANGTDGQISVGTDLGYWAD